MYALGDVRVMFQFDARWILGGAGKLVCFSCVGVFGLFRRFDGGSVFI